MHRVLHLASGLSSESSLIAKITLVAWKLHKSAKIHIFISESFHSELKGQPDALRKFFQAVSIIPSMSQSWFPGSTTQIFSRFSSISLAGWEDRCLLWRCSARDAQQMPAAQTLVVNGWSQAVSTSSSPLCFHDVSVFTTGYFKM